MPISDSSGYGAASMLPAQCIMCTVIQKHCAHGTLSLQHTQCIMCTVVLNPYADTHFSSIEMGYTSTRYILAD